MNDFAPAGAIIETRGGATYHIRDTPRAARADLRTSAAIGAASVFLTRAGHPIVLYYDDVRRVRSPREPSRLRRRLRAWGLFLASMTLTVAGTIGIAIGGSALLATMFGHGDQITWPWYSAIPGFALYYAGGWIGHEACNELGIE